MAEIGCISYDPSFRLENSGRRIGLLDDPDTQVADLQSGVESAGDFPPEVHARQLQILRHGMDELSFGLHGGDAAPDQRQQSSRALCHSRSWNETSPQMLRGGIA